MLLSPIFPAMSVFKLKTGQNIHRGYVASFRQEYAVFIDEVPRLADKIPIIIVKRNIQYNTSIECKINRARVQAFGRYLEQHHPEFVKSNITLGILIGTHPPFNAYTPTHTV